LITRLKQLFRIHLIWPLREINIGTEIRWRWPRLRSWTWLAAIAVAGFLGYYQDATAPKPTAPKVEPEPIESASTFIPDGFVLVPIELANFESLDSILGKFGVVDLYLPADSPRGHARKIATHIKILRAPLNPSHFAVLVRETESARLVTHTGPFIAVVQNHERVSGTGLVNVNGVKPTGASQTNRSRISVEVRHAQVEY
jgi:hypothetical protein